MLLCIMQGGICGAHSHHAAVTAHHGVPLPRHRALHAVPVRERQACGGELSNFQRKGAPAVARSPTQGDRADARVYGGSGLCHPPLCQVRPFLQKPCLHGWFQVLAWF